MNLGTLDSAALAARRARLGSAMTGTPVLVAAGKLRPRNYAANFHLYRASSHFLYLFGAHLENGQGLWDGSTWTLHLPVHGADDALWHGPQPSHGEIGAALGVAVKPLGDLPAALAKLGAARVATLPTPDLETCEGQAALLGRAVRPGQLLPQDEPLADAMIALRLQHDAAAQKELRLAADGTAAAHAAGMKATRPGVTEAHVRAAMEQALAARGMGCSYNSIVTVHGEVLHNNDYGHTVGERDMILADVGAETAGGWAGDVTRGWPAAPRFSTTQREMYECVLSAQVATVAAVKPGVRYRDLHLLAARLLAQGLIDLGILKGNAEELVADGVHALLFPHGIGHLLGLDVHDMEDLGDRAGYAPGRTRSKQFGLGYLRLDRDLLPGMAVTIEPGLYIVPALLDHPDLGGKLGKDRLDRKRLAQFSDVRGIRIEDDVLVTDTGHEVLTAAIPKTVADVEAARA